MRETHPIADIFPMLPPDELQRLADDIASRGLLDPVVLLDDMVLDGRNRYAACLLAKVTPDFVEFTGDDALGYVIAKNLHRRHMNESQRAAVAAKLANMRQGGDRPSSKDSNFEDADLHVRNQVSQSEAAAMLNVSPRLVAQAKAIERDAPELIPAIERGELTVGKASRDIKLHMRKEERIREMAATSAPNTGAAYRIDVRQGNMLDVVPALGKFDLVIADPPYNVTQWEWDVIGNEYLDLVRQWLTVCRDVLTPQYHMFWFCSPSYSADTEMILRDLDLPIQSRVVWHRRNMSKGSDAKIKFIDTWEMVFHIGNHNLNFSSAWDDSRFDVQIHAVPQTNFEDTKLHPTQKPISLIQLLVNFGSGIGARVLDPFAGSGTTGEACLGTRECVLVEQEEEYVNVIRQRLGL